MDYIPRVHSELAIAYDDDVIHSNSRNIHKGQQLKLLKNSGLTGSPKKCRLGLEEVECLGFTIGQKSIKPKHKKIRS